MAKQTDNLTPFDKAFLRMTYQDMKNSVTTGLSEAEKTRGKRNYIWSALDDALEAAREAGTATAQMIEAEEVMYALVVEAEEEVKRYRSAVYSWTFEDGLKELRAELWTKVKEAREAGKGVAKAEHMYALADFGYQRMETKRRMKELHKLKYGK